MSNCSRNRHRVRRGLRRFGAITALALLCHGGLALALEDDRNQPIRITADTAIRDEKQGFTVYSGNVVMIQGSLNIAADKITIFHETERADKIVAEGQPATMQQQPTPDEALVTASAGIIEYYKAEDRVHLRINASIAQEGATVTGDFIDYLITEQLVKADSDQAMAGNRVEVVIPPDVIREDDAASGPTDSE